jgi:hypothetical protein
MGRTFKSIVVYDEDQLDLLRSLKEAMTVWERYP